MILQQSYYPSGTSLFDERKLAGLHVLELGSALKFSQYIFLFVHWLQSEQGRAF